MQRDASRNDIDPKKFITVYNGVNGESLALPGLDGAALRREAGIPPDARVIAVVGLAPIKRPDILVKALPKITAAVPSAYFLFVGELSASDAAYSAALRRAIEESGSKDRVIWWGFECQIGRVYAISDILVHCNRNEPLARCMIEALSIGLPVIGPDGGGSSEVVEHGRNGLLYTPDSPDHLAEAVVRILTDDALRENMRYGARLSAARFTVQGHVTRVQDLYRELLAADDKPAVYATTVPITNSVSAVTS